MKKLITLDAIMVSLISAMGYGIGYAVPNAYGLGPILSGLICMGLGGFMDQLAKKIVYSSDVQKSGKKRFTVFACIALAFLFGYGYLATYFAHSLWDDVLSSLLTYVGIPVGGFLLTMAVNAFRRKRMLKKYGTGESGFIIDKKTEKQLGALMGTNREIAKPSGEGPAVKTLGGTYVGKEDGGCVRFLGIPYAQAPVGQNRWKRPVPVEASTKVFEALNFGPSEIQPENSHNVLSGLKQDEDCLHLNVWTANLEPNAKKPVLVYFHGGDGRYSGCANPVYHLENLAKGIPNGVFVSFNYRYGAFGVVGFDPATCPDAGEFEDSAALTLLDQIEALKWIRANIAAFGGDPRNVTLAGDSSGGTCICLLAAMEEAKGLFKRALVLCTSSGDAPAGDAKAYQAGKALMDEYHASSVASLQSLSSDELREFTSRHYDLLDLPPKDGKYLPLDLEQTYLEGAASGIEFVFGIAADDVSAWQGMFAGDDALDAMADQYYEELKSMIGPQKAAGLDAVFEKYTQSKLSVGNAKLALLADLQSKASILHDCRTLARGGGKVRCFYWDVKGEIEALTANTVSVVTAILGNEEIAEQMGYINDANITEIMQAFVSKFMRRQPMELFNNEINGIDEIVWDEFDAQRGSILKVTNEKIEMASNVLPESTFELERLVLER